MSKPDSIRSNADLSCSAELRKQDDRAPETSKERVQKYLLDLFAVVGMSLLLFWGAWLRYLEVAATQSSEPTRYRCYAVAFWKGISRVSPGCSFVKTDTSTALIHQMQLWGFPGFLVKLVESQSPTSPLHALPHEYPLLTIIPFTLVAFVSTKWYFVAFAIMMAFVAGAVYFLIKRYKSTGAALAFAFYLVIGSWATALARFDLIPAALTLGTVILAERAKWKWAFALLALATMFKFYALVLILPVFIAQQQQYSGSKWYAWRRWDGITMFVCVCMGVTALSLVLSVDGTLGPLSYFSYRPIQVESHPAGILWIASFIGYSLDFDYSFGSGNVLSPLSSQVSLVFTLCFILGLMAVYWLQWRGRLNPALACLLTLLVVIVTGKVFSPQYLIWATPFVAYVGKSSWKWLVGWGSVGLLTTFIYPHIYTVASATPGVISVGQIPEFYPSVLARGFIILAIIAIVCWGRLIKWRQQEGADIPENLPFTGQG
jgi:hypothetical protein